MSKVWPAQFSDGQTAKGWPARVRLDDRGIVIDRSDGQDELVWPYGALKTDNPISRERITDLPFLAGNPRFMEPNLSENLRISDGFRKLAAEMGTSAAGLANAWLLSRGPHVIPIPGTRSVDHLRECVSGAALKLTEADLAGIEAVLPVGWAYGDRYSDEQWIGPERYC